MSALAPANPVKQTSQTLAQSEADLRTEATAIEKLRKQIGEAGATASKEMMAEFAKRQKAYLNRKIELEKQKRTGDAPAAKTEPAKAPAVAKAPEPAKPAAEKKPDAPKTAPATKKEEPAKAEKPAEKPKPVETPKVKEATKAPEKKADEPKKKDAPVEKSDSKSAKPEAEKSSAKPSEPKAETSPAKKGGISPIVWILVVAAIAVAAWHFLNK